MNNQNCTPLQAKKNRVPLSPITPEYSPYLKPRPQDAEKENQEFHTPSTYESPLSDMESPYFTLR